MSPLKIGIQGIQEAQRANERMIAAVRPDGNLGRAVLYLTTALHRYLVAITHVDTGTYRASQRMQYSAGGFLSGPQGQIYVDPMSVNPVSHEKPADYALIEEGRGGEHAAYRRTVDEYAVNAASAAANMIYGGLR